MNYAASWVNYGGCIEARTAEGWPSGDFSIRLARGRMMLDWVKEPRSLRVPENQLCDARLHLQA